MCEARVVASVWWAFYSFSSVYVYSWSYSVSVFESSSFAENYKDAKLLGKRSKFITEREKKNTIFLYFPWDAGAQRDENFTVLGVTQSENEDIAFCRASKARGLYIYIWNGQQEAHAKNKRFFLNVWIYIWDGVWLDDRDREWGCVSVCLLHMAGEGSPLLVGCHDDHWVLFSSLSKLHLHP